MVEWASGIGGFFEGYNQTVGQRSAERDKKYTTLMQQAQHWGKVADDFRSRPIQDENSKNIIAEAEENMKKAMFDAEKEMNRKIGGLSKLGGLLNQFLGKTKVQQQGGGSQEQAPEAAPSGDVQEPPAQLGQDQLAAPPQEGTPAPMPAYGQYTTAPPLEPRAPASMPAYGQYTTAPVGQAPAPMAPRTEVSEVPYPPESGALTAPPEAPPQPEQMATDEGTGAALKFGNITVPIPPPPGSSSQDTAGGKTDPLRPSWLPEGKHLNPELFVKDYVSNFNDLQVARKKGDIKTEVMLDREHRKYQQDINDRTETFDEKFAVDMLKSGYDPETIEKARISYVLGNEALMSPKVKTWVDPTSYQDTDGKWYKNVYRIDEDGGHEFMSKLPTGPRTQQVTADVKTTEAIRDYIAAHPGTQWADAEAAVRSRRETMLSNKLKQSGFKSVSDELLVQYRRDRNKGLEDARKAKEAGTGMDPKLAQTILTHADSMAKSMYPADELKLLDDNEAFTALMEASNNWLMVNVGLSRDDVINVLRGKSSGERKEEKDRLKEAENMLLSPPTEEKSWSGGSSSSTTVKKATTKKTGTYAP